MKNNLLNKIPRADLKYIIASLILIVFLMVILGYGLFFLADKASQVTGFPRKNIPADNTRFDVVKLEQFKKDFPPFGK
ncbi:MAG: hypothetical protein NTX26_01090 [Candidatus Parcubacteria bacterium]|nr:hypothetical protein [Candidatus Parcubacteria bacterium]